MKRLTFAIALVALGLFLFGLNDRVNAAIISGAIAPDFTATDTNGVTHTLSALKGKYVVLEWTNHQCPFVRKHYESGNMQTIQKETLNAGDTIWFSIISSAPGKQGNITAKRANELTVSRGAFPSAVILDPAGKIGRLYGAKTTPHMFVIDKEGKIAYHGAIDSLPSPYPTDLKTATNFVHTTLASLRVGASVSPASTQPYGCYVKY